MTKKILSHLAIVALALLFITSGYTKLFPIEYFEAILVKYNVISWNLSKYIARLIISLEFVLGVFLLAHIRLKRVLQISFGIVLFFTILLVFQLISDGNEDNCGCFGNIIEFSITEAIIKNIVTLLMIFAVVKFGDFKTWKAHKMVVWLVPFIILTTVNVVNPPFNIYSDGAISLEYKIDVTEEDSLGEEWKQGRKLLVFVSSQCPHCREASFRISVKYPVEEYGDKIIFVFAETTTPEHLKEFKESQNIEGFQDVLIEKIKFLEYTQASFPKMAIINDGKSEKIYRKYDFFQQEVDF